MKKRVLLGVLLSTTITLSAQQTTLMPQTGIKVTGHQISPAAALDESALLEEFYHMEELAAFDLAPVPERMQSEKVAEVREASTSDIRNNAKAAQPRQSKTHPALVHLAPQAPGQRSKPFSIHSNQFQTPGLISIIPKLFLSLPRVFKMIGR